MWMFQRYVQLTVGLFLLLVHLPHVPARKHELPCPRVYNTDDQSICFVWISDHLRISISDYETVYDEYNNYEHNDVENTYTISYAYGYTEIRCRYCIWPHAKSMSFIIGEMTNLRVLNFSNSAIETIAANVFVNENHIDVTDLDLSHNMIVKLDEANMFSSTPSLNHLWLQGNQIESIHDEAFRDLDRLQLLDLSANRLKTFNGLLFVGNARAIEIYVTHNSIERVENTNASAPMRIEMGENSIDEDLYVNAVIVNVTQSSLPAHCSFGPKLEVLYASVNNITSVDFSESVSLRHVQLQHNRLTEVDLQQNPMITALGLDNNVISRLDISSCTNLITLRVQNNNLTSLDVVVARHSLRELDASHNRLTNISLTNFSSLAMIDVSHNQIEHIDLSGPYIQFLNISQNNIQSVHPAWLPSSLTTLDLSHNNLTILEPGTFAHLSHLLLLQLQHCQLIRIQYGLFTSKSIQYLDLSENPLSDHFSLNTLFGLQNVQTLLLHNCGIRQPATFSDTKSILPTLLRIGISANPWACADLVQVIRWLTADGIQLKFDSQTSLPDLTQTQINGIACTEHVSTDSSTHDSLPPTNATIIEPPTQPHVPRAEEVAGRIDELERQLDAMALQSNTNDIMHSALVDELKLIRTLMDDQVVAFGASINRTLADIARVQQTNSRYHDRLAAQGMALDRTMDEQYKVLADRVEYLGDAMNRRAAQRAQAMALTGAAASSRVQLAVWQVVWVVLCGNRWLVEALV